MKKLSCSLISFFVILAGTCFSQQVTMDFSFSGIYDSLHVSLDSVKVMNRSQGGAEVIYYPDTMMTIDMQMGDTLLFIGYTMVSGVGTGELTDPGEGFEVLPVRPNPVSHQGKIGLMIPENEAVEIFIYDLRGNRLFSDLYSLEKGYHEFEFTPGNAAMYILSAKCKGKLKSIKILSSVMNSPAHCKLDYSGRGSQPVELLHKKDASMMEWRETGILDHPDSSRSYAFQFASNIPCPGMPSVTYEGQVYNTVQIGNQCWMRENLNVGTMIPGTEEMSDNDTIEKFCYNDDPDVCEDYGALYYWSEAMSYVTEEGARGICPPGWHIPTHEELKILEGLADNMYHIGDPEWDIYDNYRGFDAGRNLKSSHNWLAGGHGPDEHGFRAMPGGAQGLGYFSGIQEHAVMWTSTEHSDLKALFLSLGYNSTQSYRLYTMKTTGRSIRCLRDF